MLTLSKVVVEVGNRADAARAGDYRLELEAAPEAFARTDYQLAAGRARARRSERGASSLWLGADDALARFGVRRGEAIERDELIAVLQGQHVADRRAAAPAGRRSSARRGTSTAQALVDERGPAGGGAR